MAGVLALPGVVIDTNVFVANGFNPESHSAQIIKLVNERKLTLYWNEKTRDEVRLMLKKIPPIGWDAVSHLFRQEGHVEVHVKEQVFDYISDLDDRKFATVAFEANVPIVTNDEHFLEHRKRLPIGVYTPHQFMDYVRTLPEFAADYRD